MTTEWIPYTGSPEQIAEIHNSENGFIVRFHDGRESDINHINIHWTRKCIINYLATATHYLFCNSHPLADMIIRQAQTGQPVWLRFVANNTGNLISYHTTDPDWNIPGAEYSFTPFEEAGK